MFKVFSRKPGSAPPEQLQVHQYLDLLQAGTEKKSIAEIQLRSALASAQALWSGLGLGSWPKQAPANEYNAASRKTGDLLIHLAAGPRDSFLILVFAPGASEPRAYIH